MATGERIQFLRNLRGMTQKWLGVEAGFPERSADVRIAQYETGGRMPKAALIQTLSEILQVDTHAITVPDIDSALGLAHTLFALEDIYGLKVAKLDGQYCLRAEKNQDGESHSALDFFEEWHKLSQQYENSEITKEAYDYWRYYFPTPMLEDKTARAAADFNPEEHQHNLGTSQVWAKSISHELSDLLQDAMEDED
ncbi:helix-turn-helix transcriptional regulator [Bengtsoniella intestinalis]|uniref:helix-turn-helix domain-containing protein n=1 Tax=Bengtsoniella intestinalis TaxID=3073143 RepID=UPI00391F2342